MQVAEYRTLQAKAMDEATLQSNVVALARDMLPGWRHYHTHTSKFSPKGWPDLVLIRPPRLVFAELKRVGQRPTSEQQAWLADLSAVAAEVEALTAYCLADHTTMAGRCPVCLRDVDARPLIEVHLWTPTHLLSGEIARVLR